MFRIALVTTALTAMMGMAMAQERISISSDWGTVDAVVADNAASNALLEMLPVTIRMRDHLRQEKTGDLPRRLPESPRVRDFTPGTIGLWGSGDFVVYYREGRVPRPGIVVLGQVQGDVSIFDRPGDVSVRIERTDR